MAQVMEEEQDPSSTMETQPEAADLKQQTPNTTKGKKITPSELKDQESEKIRRILAQVKTVLEKSAAKRRGGKKPQILIFYHKQREKKNEDKPKEDGENLEDPPGTSNSPGQPIAEDTAVSTTSPEKELQKE